MKRIITLFSFCFCVAMVNAQDPPALKVAASGKVGIGTANPTSNLEIKNLVGEVGAGLRFRSNNTTALFNYFDGGGDGLSSQWNVDAVPGKADGNVNLGFFRSTNTTGVVGFIMFEGKNTQNINSYLGANTNTYLNNVTGAVSVGTNAPVGGNKLNVTGTAYKTQGGSEWAIPSDKKLKSKIKKYHEGLNIISKISPVEYEYNGLAGTREGDYQIGVIAQDFQKVAPFMVEKAKYEELNMSEFAEKTTTHEEDILTVNPSALKWIMVNAINEQQEMIEQLRLENEKLREDLEVIKQSISLNQNSDTRSSMSLEESKIGFINQNSPNPFSNKTTIKYFIPSNTLNATLTISNSSGQIIQTKKLQTKGHGTIDLDIDGISNGQYYYTLSIDGKQVDVKKMSIVR